MYFILFYLSLFYFITSPLKSHCATCTSPGSRKCSGACELSWRLCCCCRSRLPVGSNGELHGSGSDRSGTPVLGSGPADAGGSELAGGGRVGTGEVEPGHQ